MFKEIGDRLVHFVMYRRQVFADSEAEHRFHNYALFCMTGLPLMLLFGMYNLFLGKYLLGSIIFLSFGLLLGGLYLLYNCLASKSVYRVNIFIFCVLLTYMLVIGGEDGSKSLWSYVFPLVCFFLLGNREGMLWNGALLFCANVVFFNPMHAPAFYVYSAEFAVRFSLSFFCVGTITYFYERFRFMYRVRIEEQNRQLNREVLERGRVETALRLSEVKYKAIYLQAAEGILVVDPAGVILESNPQICKMLGAAQEHLVGTNVHTLMHPYDLEKIPSRLPKIMAGETTRLERSLRLASGQYRQFELSGRKVDEGRVMLLVRDITERKAAEMALAMANQELDRLANLDGLTKIANRRRFETAFDIEWRRLRREGNPLTVILGDVDFFKQYNDLYGHQEGDSCLVAVARAIEDTVRRPADLAARWGGEEFIVLLPNTPQEGGMLVAENIRQAIEKLLIVHQGSRCSDHVTLSLGVGSIIPDAGNNPEMLIALADQALYMAKDSGRNRVMTVAGEDANGSPDGTESPSTG